MARISRATYITAGSTDGACGHRHRCFLDALRCLDAHWRRNRRTDRKPERLDGTPLTDDEKAQLSKWEETPPEVRP